MADRISVYVDEGKKSTILIASFWLFNPSWPNYVDKKRAYKLKLKNAHGLSNITKMENYVKVLRKLAKQIELDLKNGVYNG